MQHSGSPYLRIHTSSSLSQWLIHSPFSPARFFLYKHLTAKAKSYPAHTRTDESAQSLLLHFMMFLFAVSIHFQKELFSINCWCSAFLIPTTMKSVTPQQTLWTREGWQGNKKHAWICLTNCNQFMSFTDKSLKALYGFLLSSEVHVFKMF